MGDRANFGIRQKDGNTIFVYGHWAGHEMFARFANAIDRASIRLPHDSTYANRIIISQLVGTDWSGEFGWGITINYLSDNEHKVPVYDLATDDVILYDYDWTAGILANEIVRWDRSEFVSNYSKSLMGE